MKTTSRALGFILALTALVTLPFCVYAKQTKTIFNSNTYTHQSQFDKCTITQGVDLSYHNGTVDFAKLKKAGVKFVILRAGYTGYTETHSKRSDTQFETYIKDAIKQGLQIGVYYYSQAVTQAEAKSEANYTISLIKNYKNNITLPVAFDYEFAEVSDGRFDRRWNNGTLNKTKCTAIAKAYCDTIKNSGYKPMIYANKSFLSEVLDGDTLAKSYPIWMANYTTNTTYSGKFSIWQFSAKGTVNGVSGYVDSNFMYSGGSAGIDIETPDTFNVKDVADMGYTGDAVKPVLTVTVNGKTLVKGEDYYVTYANNIEIGTASVTLHGLEDYTDIPDKTVKFNIVPAAVKGLALDSRTHNTLQFHWKKNDYADKYRVQIKKNGSWVTLATTAKTSYTAEGLDAAALLYFRVSAVKTKDSVDYIGIPSAAFSAATKPVKVKNIRTEIKTDTTLKLRWDMQKGATQYIVYRLNPDTAKYEEHARTQGGKYNALTVKGLTANTKYTFKVRAVKTSEAGKQLTGAASNAYTNYTTPKAPALRAAKSKAEKRITAAWTQVGGADGYQVMWSTTSTFTQNYKTKNFSAKKKAGTVITARSNTGYYVRVRAYKIRGNTYYYSPWSSSLHVYTK